MEAGVNKLTSPENQDGPREHEDATMGTRFYLNENQKKFFAECEYQGKNDNASNEIDSIISEDNVDVQFVDDSYADSCTLAACIGTQETDTHVIRCNSCRRLVHWKCTALPPYQLQQFINTEGTYIGYICVNCVLVTESVVKVCAEPNEFVLQQTLQEQAAKILDMQEKLDKYREAEESRKCESTENTKKKRKRNCEAPEEDECDQDESRALFGENKAVENLNQVINNRFEKIEKALTDFIQGNQRMVEAEHRDTNIGASYASIASKAERMQNSNQAAEFRTILRTSKNEELVEERDRKSRTRNLIIHGKKEDESEATETDAAFVSKFLKDVCVGNLKPKSITRLGQKDLVKIRPIKVNFEHDREKEKILANLGNLKDIDEYIGISITADYTQSERRLIKEKAVEVKAKNEKEPENSGYIWKLRGSPKNGLSIRRVPRMRPQKNM